MNTLNATMNDWDRRFPGEQTGGLWARFTEWIGAMADYRPRPGGAVSIQLLAGSCCGDWISDDLWRLINTVTDQEGSKPEEKRNV